MYSGNIRYLIAHRVMEYVCVLGILTLDGVLSARLEPGQGSDLGLPHQPEGVGHAQLPHHQLHRGPDLGRVRVTPVHHLVGEAKIYRVRKS